MYVGLSGHLYTLLGGSVVAILWMTCIFIGIGIGSLFGPIGVITGLILGICLPTIPVTHYSLRIIYWATKL